MPDNRSNNTVAPLADYHVHTPLCGHAGGTIDEYVEQAIALGLAEIGFADHMPMEVWNGYRPRVAMALTEMATYQEQVERARAKFAGRIQVRFGLEADYRADKEREIGEFLRRYPFDYVIGSVHFIGPDAFDLASENCRWNEVDIDEVYELYYRTLERSIRSGLFDIVGHIDIPKKFGHYTTRDLTGWYERIAAACTAAGSAVEINTSGLIKPCREMYPHPDFLGVLYRHNAPVTFGSDAHSPAEVGREFAPAVALARSIGYRQIPYLAGRRLAGWLPLPAVVN